MSWRDNLRPASFRGAVFEVDAADSDFGRRNVTHEFPQRDKPYVEDLGKKAREFKITGFVIGPDYMTARDKLLIAIETAGPGTLVHPLYGEMRVNALPCSVKETRDEGGMARFALGFVESGDFTFLAASPDTAGVVESKALAAATASQSSFSTFFASVTSMAKFVAENALFYAQVAVNAINQVKAFIRNPTGAILSLVGDLTGGGTGDLAHLGQSLWAVGNELYDLIAEFSPDDGPDSFATFYGIAGDLQVVQTTTSNRLVEQSNQDAFVRLMTEIAVIQEARSVQGVTFTTADDATAMQDQLTAKIDAAAEATPDDAVYAALIDLKAAVVAHIAAEAVSRPNTRSVTPPAITSSLTLAYELYGDATRSEEIVERNDIPHPGFIPTLPLTVLAS